MKTSCPAAALGSARLRRWWEEKIVWVASESAFTQPSFSPAVWFVHFGPVILLFGLFCNVTQFLRDLQWAAEMVNIVNWRQLLREISAWLSVSLHVHYMFSRYFCFHPAACIFPLVFCFPDLICFPLLLDILNSYRLLMITVLKCPPSLSVHQWGSCTWGLAAVF